MVEQKQIYFLVTESQTREPLPQQGNVIDNY